MDKIKITDGFETNGFSSLCFVWFHSGPFAKDINTKKLFRLEFVSYTWVIYVRQQISSSRYIAKNNPFLLGK